jgi:hypothetical protein
MEANMTEKLTRCQFTADGKTPCDGPQVWRFVNDGAALHVCDDCADELSARGWQQEPEPDFSIGGSYLN